MSESNAATKSARSMVNRAIELVDLSGKDSKAATAQAREFVRLLAEEPSNVPIVAAVAIIGTLGEMWLDSFDARCKQQLENN